MLAITAGLRLGELLALRWREVDLDLAHLQVVATLVNRKVDSGRRHVELAEPKIPRSRRLVQLSGAAVEALRRGYIRSSLARCSGTPTSPSLLTRTHM